MVKSYWNIRLIWTPSRILGSIIYIFYEDVLYSQPKSVKSKSVGHMTARCVNYSLRGHVTPTFWVKKWNGSKTKNPLKINSESYQLLIFSSDYQVNTILLVESCPKWPNLGIKLLPKYRQLSTIKMFIYQSLNWTLEFQDLVTPISNITTAIVHSNHSRNPIRLP